MQRLRRRGRARERARESRAVLGLGGSFEGRSVRERQRHDQGIVCEAVKLLVLFRGSCTRRHRADLEEVLAPARRARPPCEDVGNPDCGTRAGMSPGRLRSLRLFKTSTGMPMAQSQRGTPESPRASFTSFRVVVCHGLKLLKGPPTRSYVFPSSSWVIRAAPSSGVSTRSRSSTVVRNVQPSAGVSRVPRSFRLS